MECSSRLLENRDEKACSLNPENFLVKNFVGELTCQTLGAPTPLHRETGVCKGAISSSCYSKHVKTKGKGSL